MLTRGAEKPEPEKGKGSAERRRENATVKPPPGRTITISRRATRSLYQEKRFTSNLFLSFRGNRSPMTFCPSFPPFRSSMLVRPYAFHEACTEILPPTKPFGSRCTSSVCFVRVVSLEPTPFAQAAFHRPIDVEPSRLPPLDVELARPIG